MSAAALAGPRLHAFIVGVSHYPNLLADPNVVPPPHHLGLRPLGSAAMAAHRMDAWLVAHAASLAVPLGSRHLLLSPSPSEGQLADLAPPATAENFETAANAWRDAARGHRDNIALFYFAGHGLIRKRSERAQVLLMQDFGDAPTKVLRRGLEASNILSGMAPLSAADPMARTQLFFVDACRTLPEKLPLYEELEGQKIWDIPGLPPGETYLDDRLGPVFYTTEPGARAFGIEGTGSLFGEALLRCLDGGAGTFDQPSRRWQVTVASLVAAIGEQMKIVNREFGAAQVPRTATEAGRDAVLRLLDAPPVVDVEITIEPAARRPEITVALSDRDDVQVRNIPAPFPAVHADRLPAGSYRLIASSNPPFRDFVTAAPPFSPWPVVLP